MPVSECVHPGTGHAKEDGRGGVFMVPMFSVISSSSSRTRVGGHIMYMLEKRPDRLGWWSVLVVAPKLFEFM